MKNFNLKAEFFLGKPNNPSDGDFYQLPMDPATLRELLYSGSYIISEYNSDIDVYIREYDKETLMDLNEVLNSKDERLVTLYMWADQDLEHAKTVLSNIDNSCYLYLDGIEDGAEEHIIEQIGERIVAKGILGDIPKFLIDNGYIDYYKIGNDYWLGNVSHFEKSTNSVFIHHNRA